MKVAVCALSLAATTLASWTSNINYRSPSEHHPGLGISLHKVNKRNVPGTQIRPSQLNFTHGVASGDPYPESVIIWTRASPMFANVDDNSTVTGTVPLFGHGIYNKSGVTTAPICVEYKLSEDDTFSHLADSGVVYTSSDIDYTVKVEAKNLKPFTSYNYQFNICGSDKKSPVGRTKTTPRPGDSAADVGLAIYSCSNFPFGFFNAYGNPVRKQSIDYVVHLGDYIYEYAGDGDYGDGRPIGRISNPPKIIYTLYDYRARLANYREDKDLLLSHQNYPWIPVWDDHEVADNYYRDGASDMNNTEESFVRDGGISVDQRKMNAVRAYFEWMPIRQVEMDDNLRIWRSFSVGSLFDLIMLDTRNYDRSITDLYWNTGYIQKIANEASRSLMGSRQENWFYNTLGSSAERGATWRLIGSQLIFSRLNQSLAFGQESPFNLDAWDGYLANRNRTLEYLTRNNIGNNIFMAGDSHASWVSDLTWFGNAPYDSETGAGSLGAEFAGTAVSSPSPYGRNISLARAADFSRQLVEANPELQWQDLYYRGYYELHITPQELTANFFGMPNILNRNPNEISIANFTVKAGENRLQRPIGGGVAESGFLRDGTIRQTNITKNTETGEFFISQ
ncbi:Alkaline phosphatase D [Sphaceloma murrayae]|uniref:Alkaline phosphatase D n=1 Tax=Sphaceloma murrayae TaxID=2082308 RepID=A0A2K1QT16_9PEZI|nr:Alkaline phosphatase D [Sphaceloma murrayae]